MVNSYQTFLVIPAMDKNIVASETKVRLFGNVYKPRST